MDKKGRILLKTLSVDEKYLFETKKLKLVGANYVELDGTVYLIKRNGVKERIGTIGWWNRVENFKVEREKGPVSSIKNYNVRSCDLVSCGLCPAHKNTTALLNIVVTNRCNLRCWYCFFYAEKSGFVYEPSLEEIKKMFLMAKRMNGYMPPIQITGGEPTLRSDIEDIITLAKKLGSPHIQLNTNSVKPGIEYYFNKNKAVDKLRKWKEAGLNTIYTSFDGLDEKIGFKNHYELPLALKAYSEAGIKSVVLVPTIYKSSGKIPGNLSQVNDIIKFAVKNRQYGIKGVNFQPISLVGSVPIKLREKLRVTQSDIIDELYEVGLNKYEYWYPIPSVQYLADIIAKDENHVRFYNNELCGVATYVFVDENNRIYPITHFVNVDKFLKDIENVSKSLYRKLVLGLELVTSSITKMSFRKALAEKLKKYIIVDELPDGTKLSDILNHVIEDGSYSSLGMFHEKALFIGMMHFMDPYNYDVNRVQRCSIHYATPRGVIPFCTYNVFPHIYRDEIMRKYSIKNDEIKKRLIEKEKEEAKKVTLFREKVKNDPETISLIKEFYNV